MLDHSEILLIQVYAPFHWTVVRQTDRHRQTGETRNAAY